MKIDNIEYDNLELCKGLVTGLNHSHNTQKEILLSTLRALTKVLTVDDHGG